MGGAPPRRAAVGSGLVVLWPHHFALHAGMAAAYSNRLGNMWRSIGQPKAAIESAAGAPAKGRPMLLKARLDKVRGQLNASATTSAAKAVQVDRQVGRSTAVQPAHT